MKIEIAEHGRMTESGSSLLRLIQNQDMPLLDLLVREAVQNSLDATDGKHPFVNVDISIKKFKAKALNSHLEGVSDQLNTRYPDRKGDYQSLVISDTNTVGLTGPTTYDKVVGQNFGNLLKLVYEICKPQTNVGAGGSWGLGKTIYFRLGIGLVLYYSRIKAKSGYESRLAACLVEDETKSNSIIPSKGGVKRGIAWWGQYNSHKDKTTVPLTNEKEISSILSVFGITPYSGDVTGTSIIIPYIDAQKLLQEVYPINEEKENKPYWVDKIDEYLSIAFQRWYAPRILNTHYKHGAYLRPSVNQIGLRLAELQPLFRVIRDMYVYAYTDTRDDDSFVSETGAELFCEDIKIRDVFVSSSSAGKFVYLKLNQEQLKMTPPENYNSPYQQITNRMIAMDNGNTPIVMYTRKPGMIVGYDFDGAWTHRMPKSSESEFIIGLFVINSSNTLKNVTNPKTLNPLSMEEYIRMGEKADHASWSDWNINGTNPRAVSKIQNGVIKKIATQYKEHISDTTERTSLGLSRSLANILLPPTDFGRAPSPAPGPGPNPKPPKKHKGGVSEISSPQFMDDGIEVRFIASLSCGLSRMQLTVITDFKKYDADTWEKDEEVGKPFPLEFRSLEVTEIKESKKNAHWRSVNLVLSDGPVFDDNLELSFAPSEIFGVTSIAEIYSNQECSIKGKAKFFSGDPSIRGSIGVKEVDR